LLLPLLLLLLLVRLVGLMRRALAWACAPRLRAPWAASERQCPSRQRRTCQRAAQLLGF
jgi:hypothetical protein